METKHPDLPKPRAVDRLAWPSEGGVGGQQAAQFLARCGRRSVGVAPMLAIAMAIIPDGGYWNGNLPGGSMGGILCPVAAGEAFRDATWHTPSAFAAWAAQPSVLADAMLALLEESEGRAAQVAVWELATTRRLRAGASDSWSSMAGQDGVRDADVHVNLGVATVDVEDSSFAESCSESRLDAVHPCLPSSVSVASHCCASAAS